MEPAGGRQGGVIVKVQTVHFGELEVTDEEVYTTTAPIPGFPSAKHFFFIEREKIAPFRWLQSIEDTGLTFVVVEPRHFFHDYDPKFNMFELKEIELEPGEPPIIMAIVVLPEDLTQMTANLRGPLIVNARKRMLRQVFLDTDKYTVRESIVEGIKRKEKAALDQQRDQSEANNK